MAVEFRHGDYIKGGWEIVKANLVPSVILVLGVAIANSLTFGLVGLIAGVFAVNYMAAVKAAKHEGKPMELGAFFNFDNAADKIIGFLIVGFLSALCMGIPMIFFLFMAPILADKPGTPWMNALKGALAFGKANIVPSLVFLVVCGVVNFIGALACGLGTLVTIPVCGAATFLAYEEHKAAIEAAAAADGVQL